MIAGSAVFLWAWHCEREIQTPALLASSVSKKAAQSPETSRIELSQKPTLSLEDTLALIREKLSLWQEAQANGSDDQESQERLMQEMLALITDENVAEIVQSLSTKEMNTPLGSGALLHWMHVDPVKVTNWIASRAETTEAQTLVVADGWVGHRLGLQECLDQLSDTEWKQNFLRDLGSEMAMADPQAAIEVALQMHPGQIRVQVLQAVACDWVSTDPDAALGWVAGVQDPSLRDQLVVSAVQAYALTDPAQAATWLVSEVKSPQMMDDAALNILKTWVVRDPAQAADWVAQFPEGHTKAAAVQIVSQYWQQTDHAAATAWIQNLSRGPAIPPN